VEREVKRPGVEASSSTALLHACGIINERNTLDVPRLHGNIAEVVLPVLPPFFLLSSWSHVRKGSRADFAADGVIRYCVNNANVEEGHSIKSPSNRARAYSSYEVVKAKHPGHSLETPSLIRAGDVLGWLLLIPST